MACEPVGAMRSLSGALRYGHPEGAAPPDRGGRGRGDGHARRAPGGCEAHQAPGHQVPQRPPGHPGPARGPGPRRGRPGPPAGVRLQQEQNVQAVPAAFRSCGQPPEPGGPAASRGFRGTRCRAAAGRRAPGRGRPPRARHRRALSAGARPGTEPDDRVLAAWPARHSPRCPRTGLSGTTRESLAAGGLGRLSAGTSGSATAAALPAGDAPWWTRSGPSGPGTPSATATGAVRPGRSAPGAGPGRCARLVRSATRPGLRATRSRPAPAVRPGPRRRAVARFPVVRWPPASARGGSRGSVRSGTPARAGQAAAGTRERRMAASRPRLRPGRWPWLPLARRSRSRPGRPKPRSWPRPGPAGRPRLRLAGRPRLRPAGRPRLRPVGRPRLRPAAQPRLRPAGRPRLRPAARLRLHAARRPRLRPAGRAPASAPEALWTAARNLHGRLRTCHPGDGPSGPADERGPDRPDGAAGRLRRAAGRRAVRVPGSERAGGLPG